MKSLSRLGAIIKKEVRQLRRDRLTFGMVFGLPIIQILLFGYAINTDVRHLRAAVADQADTNLSREFVANVGATQVVEYVERVSTPAELESLLRRGHISIGIVIPPDFDRRVVDQSRSAAQILVDGSDPTILSIATQLRTSDCTVVRMCCDLLRRELRISRPVTPARTMSMIVAPIRSSMSVNPAWARVFNFVYLARIVVSSTDFGIPATCRTATARTRIVLTPAGPPPSMISQRTTKSGFETSW